MAEKLPQISRDMERAELEAVAEALARSPRLLSLLRYLGEKYFQGENDQLHEYNIATEVFGRSKTGFDAGEDAIARVEAHRLRKRLKEFYETAGRDHAVQLSIPSGTYVPVFTRRFEEASQRPASGETEEPAEPLPAAGPVAGLPPGADTAPTAVVAPRADSKRSWPGRSLWVAVAALLAVALAALGVYRAASPAARPAEASRLADAATPVPVDTPPGAATVPLRMIAGYSGSPQMDSAGAIWGPDRYFHGGGYWRRPGNVIARTSDPMLFDHWRTGDFFYDIPLARGVYELHLYFVTADPESDNPATFTVGVNGTPVLQGFDVNADALGENIADERVFRDISPGADGYLHLSFTSERGAPSLSALEVLPGTAHKQLPVRLVAQRTSFTDHQGRFWHPDDYFMNGRLSIQRQQVAGSPDPELFASERYGHFTYAIPVDTRGRYTVILYFAEYYFGPQAAGVGGVGSRIFRVICNGQMLLDDFDIYKEAGSLRLLTKTFSHLRPSAQGKLNFTFEPEVNNATISGIEVLDESQ